jgi:hypothetical protein
VQGLTPGGYPPWDIFVDRFFTKLLIYGVSPQCSSQMTTFDRDGVTNLRNRRRLTEENPRGKIHAGHQQEFRINV